MTQKVNDILYFFFFFEYITIIIYQFTNQYYTLEILFCFSMNLLIKFQLNIINLIKLIPK